MEVAAREVANVRKKRSEGHSRIGWNCGQTGHISATCTKGSWNTKRNAVDEEDNDNNTDAHDTGDELQS